MKFLGVFRYAIKEMSPSMRREWIEIQICTDHRQDHYQSPSMRREWIEIVSDLGGVKAHAVSLHAEGVD